jgi:hypothetical protein
MVSNVFVDRVMDLLGGVVDESGKVLYSGAATLRVGRYYLIGINPGGEPGKGDATTILQNLVRFADPHEVSRCDYLDEEWQVTRQNYVRMCPSREHPLQRNVIHLFDQLRLDLRATCSSNLIFTRSKTVAGAGYPKSADICWPVHKLIIEIVRPEIVLVFGGMPFDYLLRRAREEAPREDVLVEKHPSGHGDWECATFRAVLEGCERRVIGLPHLSRYTVLNKDKSKVLPWLQSLINKGVGPQA